MLSVVQLYEGSSQVLNMSLKLANAKIVPGGALATSKLPASGD